MTLTTLEKIIELLDEDLTINNENQLMDVSYLVKKLTNEMNIIIENFCN